jgi:hypothetical protein
VRRALQAPDAPDRRERRRRRLVVGRQVLEKKDATSASTPRPGEYGDMFKAGIIDPTKVVRTRCRTRLGRRPADHHRGHDRREAEEGNADAGGMPAAWAAWAAWELSALGEQVAGRLLPVGYLGAIRQAACQPLSP